MDIPLDGETLTGWVSHWLTTRAEEELGYRLDTSFAVFVLLIHEVFQGYSMTSKTYLYTGAVANRTYRAWENIALPNYLLKLHIGYATEKQPA